MKGRGEELDLPLEASGDGVAGVDEAGRGPLAGPVVAAAVILPADHGIEHLGDSKVLSAARRAALVPQIQARALAWALGRAEYWEVDDLNVLQASFLAMRRAVAALRPAPRHALVDGNLRPQLLCPATAVVRGDARVASISAASILAKQARDAEMVALDTLYPGYGFAAHKGYPTAQHLEALARLGACVVHRRSFAPVRAVLAAAGPEVEPSDDLLQGDSQAP